VDTVVVPSGVLGPTVGEFMTKYEINKNSNIGGAHRQTVEAGKYEQAGDYFVFSTAGAKVLTIAAKLVYTIDTVPDDKK
jgi:hypothetical protein